MTVAVITGAGKRIGKALALSLAGEGYDIALHVRKRDSAAEAVASGVRDLGRRAAIVPAELSDAAAAEAIIPNAVAALGPVTCLINNASSFVYDDVTCLDAETWRRQFNVNLLAPALLAKSFAAEIARSDIGSGNIVNMLDDRIAHPTSSFFSYCLTKTGLETMTTMLATALAPQIRVNAIAPGLTLKSGSQDDAVFAKQHRQTPLGKGSSIGAIQQALLYLLRNDVVTGQVLFVDGGKRLVDRTADDASMS